MPIEIRCQCGKRLKAPDNLAGRTVSCPSCKAAIQVPALAATPADEDFEDDESNDKSVYSKNSKTKKRNSKKEIDTDNDYEIKHNCLTEDGAYMNTLFNSPSSISSSSNVDMRSKTIHLM